MDVVSKSFSHYWKLTGMEKMAQLKHLRKTYLTSLVEQFGDKANLISGHNSYGGIAETLCKRPTINASHQGFYCI